MQKVKDIQVRVADSDIVGRRQMLERVAGTALNSKLISRHKPFFSPMVRFVLSVFLCLSCGCSHMWCIMRL